MGRKKIPCTCVPTCKTDAACRQKRSKAKHKQQALADQAFALALAACSAARVAAVCGVAVTAAAVLISAASQAQQSQPSQPSQPAPQTPAKRPAAPSTKGAPLKKLKQPTLFEAFHLCKFCVHVQCSPVCSSTTLFKQFCTSQNVRKQRKDTGRRRKGSNTLPASGEYNDNLADMSDGTSSLSSFASITTGSSSGSGSDSDSDNETSSSHSSSEQDNFVTVSDDSE